MKSLAPKSGCLSWFEEVVTPFFRPKEHISTPLRPPVVSLQLESFFMLCYLLELWFVPEILSCLGQTLCVPCLETLRDVFFNAQSNKKISKSISQTGFDVVG